LVYPEDRGSQVQEMLALMYQSTRRHIPEDQNICKKRPADLKHCNLLNAVRPIH